MAGVSYIEKRIQKIEGFEVKIEMNGKDVRSDKQIPSKYGSYERMAKNDSSVNDWKENRFYPAFPGYEVSVLDGKGVAVHGNTRLGTVRDSYL